MKTETHYVEGPLKGIFTIAPNRFKDPISDNTIQEDHSEDAQALAGCKLCDGDSI